MKTYTWHLMNRAALTLAVLLTLGLAGANAYAQDPAGPPPQMAPDANTPPPPSQDFAPDGQLAPPPPPQEQPAFGGNDDFRGPGRPGRGMGRHDGRGMGRQWGPPPSDGQGPRRPGDVRPMVDGLFTMIDTDGDGMLCREEVTQFLEQMRPQGPPMGPGPQGGGGGYGPCGGRPPRGPQGGPQGGPQQDGPMPPAPPQPMDR